MDTQANTIGQKVCQRLVLCLDGTWNTDDGRFVTNIVEIRNSVKPQDEDGVPQRIFYDWGVGTGIGLDRLTGGAFGGGMEQKILGAYRFLSANFQHSDESTTEIYIFGFSRGAYTARALAGFLGSAGLLRPEHCNAENEARIWKYYRTAPTERRPADRISFKQLLFPGVRIRCLGVFDTVGALGIPMHWFSRFNRKKYEFHDTELGSNIDVALHALAVDEKRGAFQPAVWARPPHKPNEFVQQVWFPGVHSNVGGGYEDHRLNRIVLEWMMSRVRAQKLGLSFEYPSLDGEIEHFAEGHIYESRKPLYLYWPDYLRPAFRKILNLTPTRRGYRAVGLPPRGIVLNEFVHWTCLDRWRKYNKETRRTRYGPHNLERAIERVRQTYFPDESTADSGPSLFVIGRTGEILHHDNESDRAQVYRWLHGGAPTP